MVTIKFIISPTGVSLLNWCLVFDFHSMLKSNTLIVLLAVFVGEDVKKIILRNKRLKINFFGALHNCFQEK